MNDRDRILSLLGNDMSLRICRRGAQVDVISVPTLCRKLIQCIGSLNYDFDNVEFPFAFKISTTKSTSQLVLDASSLAGFLIKNCSISKNLIEIDYQGKFIGTLEESFNMHIDAVEYSEKNQSLLFYISGRQIHAIVSGICVDHVPNASVFKPAGAVNGTELYIDEWAKILSRYEQELKGQKRFFFWAPPKERGLLMESPEKLFRKDLAKFIEENTIGCMVDEEAYNDGGEDRVDVRATTQLEKNVYYFELKCLGACASGVKYEEKHAFEGLVQANKYVQNDTDSVVGVLVVFDARSGHAPIKWPDKIVKSLSQKVSMPPRHVKLDPTSASKGAKKTVRDALRSS